MKEKSEIRNEKDFGRARHSVRAVCSLEKQNQRRGVTRLTVMTEQP
jgi:hypothetical protein